MSVLVKGMEMPENCFECPCCRHDSRNGYQKEQCNLTLDVFDAGYYERFEGRAQNCPLITLPDHHGRLVDADALIDDLKHDVAMDQDSLDYEELTDLNREKIQFDKDCKQNAIDLLQHAPTIEPERKKGKWIDETFKPWGLVHHPYKCDQCGEHSETDSDFCPNCGADMREPEDIPMEYFESGGR